MARDVELLNGINGTECVEFMGVNERRTVRSNLLDGMYVTWYCGMCERPKLSRGAVELSNGINGTW